MKREKIKQRIYCQVITQGGNLPTLWVWVLILGLAILTSKLIVFQSMFSVVLLDREVVYAFIVFEFILFLGMVWMKRWNKRNVRKITERYLIEEKLHSSRCYKCGYDLRGGEVSVCPECGERARPWEVVVEDDEMQRLI
ncbi:hypothetical protein JD969_09785 [Planctomycetota bacterium]|nr:hypothetical protein JD969_09785 [Planctomycetota bacterium]